MSRKVLKEALDALKRDGWTMKMLEADIDRIADKVISLKPDLEKQ